MYRWAVISAVWVGATGGISSRVSGFLRPPENVRASDKGSINILKALNAPEDDSIVKERLEQLSMQIPLHHNKRVKSFIDYFVEKNRSYMKRVLADQQRYFPIFEYYLAKHGLPDELKYLSVVESGLRPSAVSRAGAAGLWQFMPSTGRLYGLKQSFYVDERRDPHQATEAACMYLKYLHNMFDDWELALAAFNSGPGRVSRAIRRSGHRKFWKIYRHLPRETRSYLPQFVAITYVMNYYAHYNLFPEARFFAMESDTVHISGGLELSLLSKPLNLCPKYLRELNPSYVRGVITQRPSQIRTTYTLRPKAALR